MFIDSLYQTKWRGDTTARSKLLLNTLEKELPVDLSEDIAMTDDVSPEDRLGTI